MCFKTREKVLDEENVSRKQWTSTVRLRRSARVQKIPEEKKAKRLNQKKVKKAESANSRKQTRQKLKAPVQRSKRITERMIQVERFSADGGRIFIGGGATSVIIGCIFANDHIRNFLQIQISPIILFIIQKWFSNFEFYSLL